MRYLLIILFAFPLLLSAQTAGSDMALLSRVAPPANDSPDTPPGTVKPGVIKVRKPSIRPFFKCEYYLTLSRVREVQVEVPGPDGFPALAKVPAFDSSYSNRAERLFPKKTVLFSKLFSEQIQYSYSFDDTMSVDTMVVELWIGRNGKLRWARPDTSYNGTMPRALQTELFFVSRGLTEWGEGGGYMTPKRFMRKQRPIAENYYCVLYVIVSSKPLTIEQKSTGSLYAPFDIPLNSPPDNEQQRNFMENNKNAERR